MLIALPIICLHTFYRTNETLIFKEIRQNDAGNYTCRVENALGFDTLAVDLQVVGKYTFKTYNVLNNIFHLSCQLFLLFPVRTTKMS